MQYTIEFQDYHLKQVLKVIAAEIATPVQILGSIGESLLRVNKDRHLAGLAPDGTQWAPLKPSTLKEKRKGGPLNKSGDMLQSFNHQINHNTLIVGFDGNRNNLLATIHQHGTEPYLIKPLTKKSLAFGGGMYKKVNHPGLPARPLIAFPVSDQQLTVHVIDHHLMTKINAVQK